VLYKAVVVNYSHTSNSSRHLVESSAGPYRKYTEIVNNATRIRRGGLILAKQVDMLQSRLFAASATPHWLLFVWAIFLSMLPWCIKSSRCITCEVFFRSETRV